MHEQNRDATGNDATHVPGNPKYDQPFVACCAAMAASVLPGVAAGDVVPAGDLWPLVTAACTSTAVTFGIRHPGGVASLFSDTIHEGCKRSNAWRARVAAVTGSWVLTAGWAAYALPEWLAGSVAGLEGIALGAAWLFQRNRSWLNAYAATRARQSYMDRWAKRIEQRDAKARAEVAELRDDAERLHLEARRLFAAAEKARRDAEALPVAAELAADVVAADARRDPMRPDMRDLVARELLRDEPDMKAGDFVAALKAKGYGMRRAAALDLRKLLLIELATEAAQSAAEADTEAESA